MDINSNGIMPNPNYYAVSKGSDWNNQLYDVNGGVNIPISRNLRTTIYINYYLKEKFRYEYDPRPNIKQNILNENIGFSYKLNSHHSISIEGFYGYSDVSNTISYSDKDTDIPFYVDKYLRWNFGYGTLQNTSSKGTTKRKLKNKGIALGYHFHNNYIKWLRYLRYQNHKTDTYRNNNKETTENDINTIFTKNKYYFNSTFLQQLNKKKILLVNISIEKQTGSNFLTIQSGKNYEYSSWINSLYSSISKWEKQKLLYQFGINLSFESYKQQDKLAQSELNHSFIQAEVQFEKEFILNKKWSFISNLHLGYKKVLSIEKKNENHKYIENLKKLDFAGKALKLFYEKVVYNDYKYLKQDFPNILYGIHLKQKNKKNNIIISILQTNYFIKSKFNWATELSLTLQY